MVRDHKAGSGEDEIFLVLRTGRDETRVRNKVNAILLAREHVRQEGTFAAVWNTDTREVTHAYYVRGDLDEATDLAVAREELKKVRQEIVGAKKKLVAARKAL